MSRETYKPNDPFPSKGGTVFSNGTEFEMWRSQCHGCRKFNPNASSSRHGCPIEVALAIGSISDGTIKAKIALRGGFAEEGPNGTIVAKRLDNGCRVIPECPEHKGYDDPPDPPTRPKKPPPGQEDLLDPRNQSTRERIRA